MLDSLIDHIERRTLFKRVAELLEQPRDSFSAADREILIALQAVRDHILEDIMKAADEISLALQQRGIPHRIDRQALIADPPQFQQLDLDIDRRDLIPAIEALETLGYRSPVSSGGAGWVVFTRTRSRLLLTHVDAATTRVRMCWQSPMKGLSRLAPQDDAVARFAWPEWTWPLALLVASLQRLLARLTGANRKAYSRNLGEWLGTPESLIEELVEFAGIGANDMVADLGCGDGRILTRAASIRGCSALGIEREADLCRLAQNAVQKAGLGERVKIVHGDAASLSLEGVSCVFLFLPAENLDTLIRAITPQLPPSARIIAHEHTPYRGEYPPAEKRLLVGDRGFTIGYLWRLPINS